MRSLERNACRSGAITLAALLAAFAPAAPAGAQQPALATLTAAYETAPRERIWDGTVEAVNRATVSSQTSGRVAAILYDVDDFVEAGAVIMRFTDTEQRAALSRAQAAAKEAEARFTEAESEQRRIAAMFDNGTVAKARYDQAQANFAAASARRDAARAGVAGATEQLDYTLVRAPYSGIVSERHVQVGELVRPGEPLMSGLSLEQLRVNVDVPQSMIDPIRHIGKAVVYAEGQAIAADSLTFYPIADAKTNTFHVRVNLPKGSATLYPGTFVKVGFVVGETERLLLPATAVVHRSELTAVYVVSGDAVELRQIRAGRAYGERIEVLAGLEPGESVATDPVAAGVWLRDRRNR
jgi:RND family efflux transporter MFP subunit